MPGQNKQKKRSWKRKALRLEHEKRVATLRKAAKATRNTVELTIARAPADETVIQVRPGKYGHPRAVLLRVTDIDLVGAHEDKADLGAILAKVGMLTLAALVRYNFEEGTDGLLQALTKWTGVDIDKLRAEVTRDEDGDLVVTSPDPGPAESIPTEPNPAAALAPGEESPT